MKKLAMFLALVVTTLTCITARAQTKEQMIADWQRAKNYTKTYLDAMPEDGYGLKPKPEMRSFAGQMLHIADANYLLAGSALGTPGPLKGSAEQLIPQTKDATTKAVMDSYDFVINGIQGMTADQFQQPARLVIPQAKVDIASTKGLLLSKAFEHQTHHRGQTTVYLRLKGVTPPQEMLF